MFHFPGAKVGGLSLSDESLLTSGRKTYQLWIHLPRNEEEETSPPAILKIMVIEVLRLFKRSTHTHKFNNLPPHTEAGKGSSKEKNEIPSLLQNNMIYISTSIHFKSGVI